MVLIYSIVFLIRFIFGRELDGYPRTDARWSRRGLEAHDHRSWRWHHWSYRRRALVRLLVVIGIFASLYGGVANMRSWYLSVLVLFWISFVIGLWLVVHWVRKWAHYFRWYPRVAAALAERLRISRHVHPLEWIDIPVGHLEDPDKVCTIRLPPDYAGNEHQKESLAQLAADTLGYIDYKHYFAMAAEEYPVLHIWTMPRPPKKVEFKDVRDVVEQTNETELLVGIDANDRPVTISLELDSPHVMCSIGPGGGKSYFCRWVALQALRKGFRVIIIDCVKRGSQAKWAKNIEGVEIYRHIDVAHEKLLDLKEQIEARCEGYWYDTQEDDQRIILIIEESNQTQRSLQSYWVNQLDGKKTSPAIQAIESILCVGREPKCNVLTVGQRMSAQASGGADARENYGIRLANRFSPQTARMLFGEIDPLPKSSNHPGRVQMITGGRAIEVQIPLCRSDEALTWALAGEPQPVWNTSDSPGNSNVVPLVKLTSASYGGRGDTEEKPIGFREAVAQGVVKCSIDVLRTQRANDSEFPKPVDTRGDGKTAEQLFMPSDLIFWERNRERRRDDG